MKSDVRENAVRREVHQLTDAEVDAIAASLQSSSRGVTIRIESDAEVDQDYQILISNRAELPERTVTKVALPESATVDSTREPTQIGAHELQAGDTLKWENLLENRNLQTQSAAAERRLPVWAQ